MARAIAATLNSHEGQGTVRLADDGSVKVTVDMAAHLAPDVVKTQVTMAVENELKQLTGNNQIKVGGDIYIHEPAGDSTEGMDKCIDVDGGVNAMAAIRTAVVEEFAKLSSKIDQVETNSAQLKEEIQALEVEAVLNDETRDVEQDSSEEIYDQLFEELDLGAAIVGEIQGVWASLLRSAESREAMGNAIHAAFVDLTPNDVPHAVSVCNAELWCAHYAHLWC